MATADTIPPTEPSTGGSAITNAKAEAQATMAQTAAKPVKISHGRGGAANIGADDQIYADGGIVREGVEGDQGDGAWSAGRGGAANIGSPGQDPKHIPKDQEIVPETALRHNNHEIFHVGRGGEGNLHHENSRSDAIEEAAKQKQESKKESKSKAAEETSAAPSVADSSSSGSKKKRRSFFGKSSHQNSDDETDPVKKAKKEEKLAKKAEHEEKYPPPTHGGLGDKLKYKIFGRLYD